MNIEMDGSNEDSARLELKNCFLLEERARALACQSKFYEAASSLEKIESPESEDRLGIKLLMAECYVQLGRENKASRAIKDVKRLIMSPPTVSIDEVLNLAEYFNNPTSFVRSMILIHIASDMYKEGDFSPNDTVDGISRCIKQAGKPIEAVIDPTNSSGKEESDVQDLLQKCTDQNLLQGLLDPSSLMQDLLDPANLMKNLFENSDRLGELDLAKGLDGEELMKKISEPAAAQSVDSRLRVIVLDIGIEYLIEMLEDLRSVEGADPERATLREAWATHDISLHLGNLKEFTKSYKIRKQGLDALDRRFGMYAPNYRICGVLLHNMGVCLHNTEKYSEAEETYERALAAKDAALDFDDHNERDNEMEITRNALKITRRHMELKN